MQYFHTMTVPGEVGDTIKDNDGNLQTPPASEPRQQACRYEPSSRPRETPTADGRTVIYNGIIYMPKGSKQIPENVEVFIPNVVKATVKYFREGLMNCKLYI